MQTKKHREKQMRCWLNSFTRKHRVAKREALRYFRGAFALGIWCYMPTARVGFSKRANQKQGVTKNLRF